MSSKQGRQFMDTGSSGPTAHALEGLRGEHLASRRLAVHDEALARDSWLDRMAWGAPSRLDTVRQELAWEIASQGSHAEQSGMLAASLLLVEVRDPVTRLNLASAVRDESVHARALAQYATVRGGRVQPPTSHADKLADAMVDSSLSPPERFMIHTLLEGIAMDAFGQLVQVFKGDLLADIYTEIARDEARHVRLGIEGLSTTVREEGKLGPGQLAVEQIGALAFTWSGCCEPLYEMYAELTSTDRVQIRGKFERNHRRRMRLLVTRLNQPRRQA